jgi:hypothetical protein
MRRSYWTFWFCMATKSLWSLDPCCMTFLSSCPCSAGRGRDVNPERFGLRNNGIHFSKYQSMYSDVKSCNLKARRVEYPDTDIYSTNNGYSTMKKFWLYMHCPLWISKRCRKQRKSTRHGDNTAKPRSVGSAVKLAPKLFNPTVN